MAIFAQNPTCKCDKLVMYSTRLLNSTKRNYTTILRKALVMIYALHKFIHYLLSKKFLSYVDHMALVHFVNKPQVSNRLTRWLFLFLEYDFKNKYQLGKSHLMANALS
jgi:hypothetical protein